MHLPSITYPVALTLLFALAATACREIPADRLYALKLEAPPTRGDWEHALPRRVTVKGGRLHKESGLGDINRDTVHTSTPSCHHGGQLPDPVVVDMRAFYTDRDLYLRLSWVDATRDAALQRWTFDGETWRNEGHLEDGFGLLWAANKEFDRFTCARACHIADFGVAGSIFHANNKMKLAQAGTWLDLWNWKADRTARYGFADDRWLDSEGMHGDTAGEIFTQNSHAAQLANGKQIPFAEDDRPLADAEGKPADAGLRLPGSTAPGYLVTPPAGGRGDVRALSQHDHGRWTVVLKRSLITDDPHDIAFRSGQEAAVSFGLSIMDHTLNEHYASLLEETLVLLPAESSYPAGARP